MNNPPISIEITVKPAKLKYIVDEPVDLSGINVLGTFVGDSTAAVKVDKSNVSGFDSSKAAGNQTVTITVEGCSDTFDVEIITAEDAWNQEKNEAELELVPLEADLKAKYNAYVDSLVTYIERLNVANDYRRTLYNSLEDHSERNAFAHSADAPIENQAVKYLLDSIIPQEVKSPTLVHACDSATLIERKVN